ncbi:MAG: hypothetical protein E7539_04590 [Ruminococcaceae bacterium]|nr:hypothetical protein [Oscillospiraceae bacterium]
MSALFILFIIGIYFMLFVFLIAAYIFQGISILNLCKKLNISNGGLGFVPFASVYKLGQIADRSSAAYREKKHYARLLLILQIVMSFLYIPFYILTFILSANNVGLYTKYGQDFRFNDSFAVSIVLTYVLIALAIMAMSIIFSIFVYIACHKIYRLFVPQNAVLFLILSILFGFNWLFLFIASRKNPCYPQVIQSFYPSPAVSNPEPTTQQ